MIFRSEQRDIAFSEARIYLADVGEMVHAFDYSPYRELYSLDPISAEVYRNVFSREALLDSIRSNFPEFPPERVHRWVKPKA